MIRKDFVIESEPRYLKPLRSKVRQFLERTRVSEKSIGVFLLAVGEACTNSIRHAYSGETRHKIRITVEDRSQKTVLKVRDYGRKIDLSKVKTPKLPPEKPHGLGIYLLKTIMDEVKYNTNHRLGNELILTKYKEQGEAHENSSQKRKPGR